MSNGRESTTSRWPELATLRALARDAAQQLQLPRVGVSASAAAAGREPMNRPQPAGRRGGRGEDHVHGHGKNAKVMHLLLWGPK